MKILVIGSGGREHAIIWKLSQSRHIKKIYCTPGNAGISTIAECIEVRIDDFEALMDFVKYNWIDLTIVGPEVPLAQGIVNYFEKEGRKIIGPTKEASKLEWSKVFAKDFMKRYNIPTAPYKVFRSYTQAVDYIRLKGAPIVIKADGLTGGKGVFVASTMDEAIEVLNLIMKDKAFSKAGDRVIIEECLNGEEVSFMVFTDGKTIVPMASSQDHKRIFDEDKGPNTGGMGAYSPAPVLTKDLEEIVINKIIKPTIKRLKTEGIKYKGILYAGLMIKQGKPFVLEFNCRFGDPETQSVLFRLDSDFSDILMGIVNENLSDVPVLWKKEASVSVVLASKGYPNKYEKGKIINGLNRIDQMEDVFVFHADTEFNSKNQIVTNSGRVLGVTALGKDIKSAKTKAYSAIEEISFDGMQFRKDIANKALKN